MLKSVFCIHLDDVYRMIAILGSLDHCIKLSTTSMLLDSCHQRYKSIRRKIDVFSINFSLVLNYVHVYLITQNHCQKYTGHILKFFHT